MGGVGVSLPRAQAAHLSDQAVVGVEVPVDDIHGVKVGLGAGGMEVRGLPCPGSPAQPGPGSPEAPPTQTREGCSSHPS